MMYRLLILGGCVWAFSLSAGSVSLDFLTVGSNTYSNVTVFDGNGTDLFFRSDRGVGNVKLKYLDAALQRKFNYNSNFAEKAEQQQVANDKLYQENLAMLVAADRRNELAAQKVELPSLYSQAGLADPVSDNSPIGKTAPSLDSITWEGTKPDLAGKLTLISVWSPKSASCRKWIPAMNALRRALPGKLEVVGITTATRNEIAKSEPLMEFPCAVDPEGTFVNAAGITDLPCVLLVDTNNVVRYQGHPAAVTTNSLNLLLSSGDN